MSKDAVLRQAYTELAKAETTGNYESALRTCNRILKTYPRELLAVRCKCVCLVQLSKFEECLTLLKKTAPDLTIGTEFEKAYSEYRLNRTDESLITLKDIEEKDGSLDLKCLELRGQLLYRKGHFEQCHKIYSSLLRDSVDDYDMERTANLLAVQVNMIEMGSKQTIDDAECDTYEQLYNEACKLVGREKYADALKALHKAGRLCKESLQEEGAAEEEVEDELALVKTQTAFCEQMIHGPSEALLNQYLSILKDKPSDPIVTAVASNNAVSARKELNLFDAKKKLKTCQASNVQAKLTHKQRRIVAINNALLLLHSNQLEPCRRAINDLRDKHGVKDEAVLIEASLLCRQKDGAKAASQLIDAYIKTNKSNNTQLYFALAQMRLADGKNVDAVKVLEKVAETRWSLGVLSLFVSVSLAENNKQSALKCLTEAVQHYSKDTANQVHLSTLLQHSASLCSKLGDHQSAANYLQLLAKIKPNDRAILSQLIQEYSHFDATKAEQISRQLPAFEASANCNGMDIDALENSGWIIMGERYRQKKEAKINTPKGGRPNKMETNEEDQIVQRRRKNRKRKKRHLPADYDPSGPQPDPERWLPRFERSTYKRKKDKRNRDRDVGRGTQGGVSNNMQLDSTGIPTVQPSETPSSPKVAAPGPRKQRPGTKKPPQKKKKGGK